MVSLLNPFGNHFASIIGTLLAGVNNMLTDVGIISHPLPTADSYK